MVCPTVAQFPNAFFTQAASTLLGQSLQVDDVIVAIASPASGAMRGVVRLSGDQVANVLNSLGLADVVSRGRESKKPLRRECKLDVGQPLGEIPIDLLFWPTKRSYTGQPSAEIHTIGSIPILQAIVQKCCSPNDATSEPATPEPVKARPAKPGEFTMRAFLAGRLDLTQAEAVLGVIEAELPGSLSGALEQLAGNLSRPLAAIRNELLDLLADVEAGLDFVDEDIEFISDDTLIQRLTSIRDQIAATSKQLSHREENTLMTKVAFRGDPNAGKSRLFNALCGSDAAIVSDVAGTTRDTVTARIEIGGHAVLLQDTAGQETVDEVISIQAQTMANQAVREASIRFWCLDASREDFADAKVRIEHDMRQSSRPDCCDLLVATKCDLMDRTGSSFEGGIFEGRIFDGWILCSGETGEGLQELRDQVVSAIERSNAEQSSGIIGTAARCHESLQQAESAITSAIDHTRHQAGHEFVSADLRSTCSAIGAVTGEVYNEDILDRVFGRFCIGK